MPGPDRLTVFYDGACPLCRREIETYRRLRGGDVVAWCDVSDPTVSIGEDLTREEALSRFHVRGADGELVSGAAAFVALWRALPLLRPLAWLADLPPLRWILEPAYRGFLKVRPVLQRVLRAT